MRDLRDLSLYGVIELAPEERLDTNGGSKCDMADWICKLKEIITDWPNDPGGI